MRSFSSPQSSEKFILDGAYEVLVPIGRGRNSVVYKARCLPSAPVQDLTGKLVALKVITGSGRSEDYDIQRTKREALALLSSSHRNVVKLIDYVARDNLCYLALEYLVRSDLRNVMDRLRVPFSPRQALELTHQMLSGLEAIHAAGIVHRDIKPENLLLTEDLILKIADFGIAFLPDCEREKEHMELGVGTFDYLAPESLQDGVSDALTDVYSAGVTCYQLLTQKLPFGGSTFTEQIGNKLSGTKQPLARYLQQSAPMLDRLLDQALSPDPSKRFQSAAEFRQAIEAYFAGTYAPPAESRDPRPGVLFKRAVDPGPGLPADSAENHAPSGTLRISLPSNDDSLSKMAAINEARVDAAVAADESELSDSLLLKKVSPREENVEINLGATRFFSWTLRRRSIPSLGVAAFAAFAVGLTVILYSTNAVSASALPDFRKQVSRAHSAVNSMLGKIGNKSETAAPEQAVAAAVRAPEPLGPFSPLASGTHSGLIYGLLGDEVDSSLSTVYDEQTQQTLFLFGIPGAKPLVIGKKELATSELVLTLQGLLIQLRIEERSADDSALGGTFTEMVTGRTGRWGLY